MDDFISRKAAIDAIDRERKEKHLFNTAEDGLLEARRVINTLPSAQLPKGEWLRMSDLSEKDDNRYKCSRCGNVVHHNSRMDLYTFNSWCGRCGSNNRRHRKFAELKGEEDG